MSQQGLHFPPFDPNSKLSLSGGVLPSPSHFLRNDREMVGPLSPSFSHHHHHPRVFPLPVSWDHLIAAANGAISSTPLLTRHASTSSSSSTDNQIEPESVTSANPKDTLEEKGSLQERLMGSPAAIMDENLQKTHQVRDAIFDIFIKLNSLTQKLYTSEDTKKIHTEIEIRKKIAIEGYLKDSKHSQWKEEKKGQKLDKYFLLRYKPYQRSLQGYKKLSIYSWYFTQAIKSFSEKIREKLNAGSFLDVEAVSLLNSIKRDLETILSIGGFYTTTVEEIMVSISSLQEILNQNEQILRSSSSQKPSESSSVTSRVETPKLEEGYDSESSPDWGD